MTSFVSSADEQGRKLCAMNLLLWQAIIFAKRNNFQYFDTGGIDLENTPAIAIFKQGIQGQEYALIGDFVI